MACARSLSRSDALQPLLVKSFHTLYEQAWRQVSTSACACKSGPPRGTNPQSTGEEREGAKSVIFNAIKESEQPLTTAQLWEKLEAVEVLKSKRFMKQMLLQMKKSRNIRAVPNVVGKSFGFVPTLRVANNKHVALPPAAAGAAAAADALFRELDATTSSAAA